MPVTRDHLYEQVWAKPMLAVAKEYEVSANDLARVCAGLNVPWPPRGYLTKVAAGQKPRRPALPPARPNRRTPESSELMAILLSGCGACPPLSKCGGRGASAVGDAEAVSGLPHRCGTG